jgi:hypothetical protein
MATKNTAAAPDVAAQQLAQDAMREAIYEWCIANKAGEPTTLIAAWYENGQELEMRFEAGKQWYNAVNVPNGIRVQKL